MDIADQKRAEDYAQRLAAIVESSDDAIVSKDLDGVITSWNRAAERIFGYTAAEVIGKPVMILIPSERENEEPEILERIRRGQQVGHYETVRRRKDGSLIDVSLTVSPIRNAENRIVGASKIARDITELRRAREQQQLLLREMDHRIKNLFSLASGVVSLSARSARTSKELAADVVARLNALARAHALTLTKPSDVAHSAERPASLHELIKTLTLPYENRTNDQARVVVGGADIEVSVRSMTSMALLLHEFTTNAAKYGALSTSAGYIEVSCHDEGSEFVLIWKEHLGPRLDREIDVEGFGSVLTRSAVKSLGGSISRDWAPDGLTIRVSVASDRLAG